MQTHYVYFSPKGGVEGAIQYRLSNAKKTIDVAAYAFTNPSVAASLCGLSHNLGIQVRVVMDRSQTHGTQAHVHDSLEAAGVSVRLLAPPGGIMHNKFIVVDGDFLETGSYNYTNRAEDSNYENAIFTDDAPVVAAYASAFDMLFTNGKPEVKGVARPILRFFRRLKVI